MPLVDVLVPTYCRPAALPMLLTSLLGQTFRDFRVTISDQTPDDLVYLETPEVLAARQALEWRGNEVRVLRHLPRRGLAEQRQFLLEQGDAPYVHFLDDDVILEPEVMERMVRVIRAERCGFVGCPATGLHCLPDERPHEQDIELWEGPVEPEPFTPEHIPWERHRVNNAANPLHLERKLHLDGSPVRYKVAWIGGAHVLYDRERLVSVGGFIAGGTACLPSTPARKSLSSSCSFAATAAAASCPAAPSTSASPRPSRTAAATPSNSSPNYWRSSPWPRSAPVTEIQARPKPARRDVL